MFKSKSKLIIAVMLMIGITNFVGCTKEEATNPEVNKTAPVVLTEENSSEFIVS